MNTDKQKIGRGQPLIVPIRADSWLKFFCFLQLVPVRGYDKLMSMKFVSATLAALLLLALAARAQPTAFTYQGRLNNGANPASGSYDFQFQIYNANSIVVGGPLTNAPVAVTNGLFMVALDFGTNVFNGGALTLEIGVRTNGSTGAYAILSPRQPVLSVPYAVQSLNASNAVVLTAPLPATNIAGTISDAQLSTNVPLRNGNQTFSGANSFTGAVTATNPANIFAGAFSGNGIGQTNLSTTNLIGTLPDARLSANVPLLNANQAFSGSNVFNGAVTANNASNAFTGAFTGSGHGLTNVPGAFFWVTVPGTNAVAGSNIGYIVTNNVTPVTIALPPAPSVGDVFKIAGVGAAGWIITQTNGQTILAGNLAPDSIGENWTPRDSVRAWSAVASSSDGTKLVATVNTGQTIYTSTNSGLNWVAQSTGAGSQKWSSVASSADGTKLVAGVGDTGNTSGNIYVSTNSGVSWASKASAQQWVSVASSSDGTKLVAAAYGFDLMQINGGVYVSVNSGLNWTYEFGLAVCSAVASSADGTKLVATASSQSTQGIWVSTNSGTSWGRSTNIAGLNSVTSSSDGSRLAATTSSGAIYISTDSGATWAATAANASGTSITSSADGSRLAAAYNAPGYISISTDGGTSWSQNAPSLAWAGIASSSDGSKLVAVANNGQIYTSSQGNTTSGTTGYLTGTGQTAIELEYVGNGIFMPLSHEGTIRAY
jgi:hypothetical protein